MCYVKDTNILKNEIFRMLVTLSKFKMLSNFLSGVLKCRSMTAWDRHRVLKVPPANALEEQYLQEW